MKNLFVTLAVLVSTYFSQAQVLPKTTVSPDIPYYSTGSIFKEVNGDVLYVSDTAAIVGGAYIVTLNVMKLNPSTNKLEPFFAIPNKKGFLTNQISYNAAAGKYLVSTFDVNYKFYYYAGTPTNMVLIDSLQVGTSVFLREYMVGNKHYLVGQDSIFSMDYSLGSINYVHSVTGTVSINYVVAAQNELYFQTFINSGTNTYELFKMNNGSPISVDTSSSSALFERNSLKIGTDLYFPYKGKTLKVNNANQLTTLNFEVQNVIAQIGNKLIGTKGPELKAFDLTAQTESVLNATIMSEYYLLDKVVFNNNICYIEGSYSNNNLIIVTDGTVAGTKSKKLKAYLGTRAEAWALCGNNLILDYKDSDVGYEVAVLKPDTTLVIYDEKPGNINGIDPTFAFNGNGTAYLIFNGPAGKELARIDACNAPAAIGNQVVKSNINVYPNPASAYVNIYSENVINKVTLFDITGKIVLAQNNSNKQNTMVINTQNLSGSYWLQILNADGASTMQQILINN
jgi:Secretion system C-terminal sorting domain